MQLTLDGGEVPYLLSKKTSNRVPLGPAQQDVIAFARLHGGVIRPIQAGIVAHGIRPSHQLSGIYRGNAEECDRCCRYAATDGCEILKSLIARGLVERISRGTYVLVGW